MERVYKIKHPKNWETALWGKERLYWKKGFIEKKALLKKRLYWNKVFIEINALMNKLLNLVKLWNLVKIVKFGWNCEIWLKLWNLAEIVKFGWNCEIWLKLWNLAENVKFDQVQSRFQRDLKLNSIFSTLGECRPFLAALATRQHTWEINSASHGCVLKEMVKLVILGGVKWTSG